jgi:hypothetical protein
MVKYKKNIEQCKIKEIYLAGGKNKTPSILLNSYLIFQKGERASPTLGLKLHLVYFTEKFSSALQAQLRTACLQSACREVSTLDNLNSWQAQSGELKYELRCT